jgi:putative heme-binding domain-containing protein
VAYFSWFPRAESFKGGNSFPKFIQRIRDLAMTTVPEDQKARVAEALKPITPTTSATKVALAPAVKREFVKTWTMADLEQELPKASSGRNFDRGREIFASLQCLACHRFNNEGGGVGPDISAVASRFGRRDILESIVEPSKVISEQYASYTVRTNKGETFNGQIVEENNDHIILVTDPLQGTRKQIGQTGVAVKKLSPVSAMPANLIDVLKKDEILDLLAYIESGGNKAAAQFSAAPSVDDANK